MRDSSNSCVSTRHRIISPSFPPPSHHPVAYTWHSPPRACHSSLYELGGVCFVVGTLGFVPASVVGISACPDGARTMETFGASLFVVGSAFYSLGTKL